MAEGVAFLAYTLALVVLPVLARWRWGLVAALAVVLVELLAVAGFLYLVLVYKLFPVPVQEPLSDHPFARMRANQAAGYVTLMIWGYVPAVAALAGGALSVVWSVVRLLWRTLATHRAGADRSTT